MVDFALNSIARSISVSRYTCFNCKWQLQQQQKIDNIMTSLKNNNK